MNRPLKRSSEVLNNLRANKDVVKNNRTRSRMLLAANIARALKEKKWSKSQLADILKKKPSVITRWLSGTHNFTSDTLTDIQNALGIDLLNLHRESRNAVISAIASGKATVNIFKKMNSSDLTESSSLAYLCATADLQVLTTAADENCN